MGFFKSSITVALMVALSAVLMQKHSPKILDSVLSDPTVRQFTIKAVKFIQDAKVQIHDTGYPIYLKGREALQPLISYVKFKLSNSPFIGEESSSQTSDGKPKKKNIEKIMTVEELKKYDGKPGSKGLYLALLGLVFNVKKGKQHYGPGGGYHFFAGRDASRAYVSGNFEEEGLTDDIRGLSYQDFIGLKDWLEFYNTDYKYVGKLYGRYYTEEGDPTAYKEQAERWIQDALASKEKENVEKQTFPPCNSEWNQEKGTRVWCTNKSGGVERPWVGLPRRLFTPGTTKPRCACVNDSGPPSLDAPAAGGKKGDLDHPLVKEYPGCGPKETSCVVGKDD